MIFGFQYYGNQMKSFKDAVAIPEKSLVVSSAGNLEDVRRKKTTINVQTGPRDFGAKAELNGEQIMTPV